jgi:hypothetical protein
VAKKLYLVPMVFSDRGRPCWYPKYLSGSGVSWAGIRWFGTDPATYLIMADVTPAQDTQLSGRPDVTALPNLSNIGNQIGGALSTVQARLEDLNLPADWVTSTMTYRQVLRYITAAMFLSQRMRIVLRGTEEPSPANLFPPGVTLATRVNELSPRRRQALLQVLQEMEVDTSGLDNSSTMRAVIRRVAEQKGREFQLFMESI